MIIIHRSGAEDVALAAAAELKGLLETVHLLRSPQNAQRLLAALERAEQGTEQPMSLEELSREVGLDDRA